jgi:hypothetical protein
MTGLRFAMNRDAASTKRKALKKIEALGISNQMSKRAR